MQISSSPLVSAMKAYSNAIDVTANNVANANTDGFKRSSSVFSEAKGGGVERRTVQEMQSAKARTPEVGEPQEKSNTDYAKESSELMVYAATAKMTSSAFKTQSSTSQTAIDMIA